MQRRSAHLSRPIKFSQTMFSLRSIFPPGQIRLQYWIPWWALKKGVGNAAPEKDSEVLFKCGEKECACHQTYRGLRLACILVQIVIRALPCVVLVYVVQFYGLCLCRWFFYTSRGYKGTVLGQLLCLFQPKYVILLFQDGGAATCARLEKYALC